MTATIGVDIDEVCLELMPTWLEIHNFRTGERLTPEMINTWGVHRFTPVGEAVYDVLNQVGLYDYIAAVPGALQGLRMLREQYRVVFVTANAKPSLEEKLNALYRHGLLARSRGKKDVVVAEDKTLARIDLLIDDKAENVEAFPGPAILFDRPWNQQWVTPFGQPKVRLHSWLTVPSFVDVLIQYTQQL